MLVLLQLARVLLAKDTVAAPSNLQHADPQAPAQTCPYYHMLPSPSRQDLDACARGKMKRKCNRKSFQYLVHQKIGMRPGQHLIIDGIPQNAWDDEQGRCKHRKGLPQALPDL